MRLRAYIPAHARGGGARCWHEPWLRWALSVHRGLGRGSGQMAGTRFGVSATTACRSRHPGGAGVQENPGKHAGIDPSRRGWSVLPARNPGGRRGAGPNSGRGWLPLALDQIRSQFSVACGAIALDTTSQAAAARHGRWRAQARKFHLQQPSLALKQWIPEDTVVDPAGNTRCGVAVQESHRKPGS